MTVKSDMSRSRRLAGRALLFLAELLLVYLVMLSYIGLVLLLRRDVTFAELDAHTWLDRPALLFMIPAAIGVALIYKLFRRGFWLWFGERRPGRIAK